MTLYPEIEVVEIGNQLKISTTLRKEHEGKWYLWNFVRMLLKERDCEGIKTKEIASFHKEVYYILICGHVAPQLVDYKGDPLFKEDISQKPETQRLTEQINKLIYQ
jgi:hypothetical protein